MPVFGVRHRRQISTLNQVVRCSLISTNPSRRNESIAHNRVDVHQHLLPLFWDLIHRLAIPLSPVLDHALLKQACVQYLCENSGALINDGG
jgi:hypothetical protein